ncbi:MAG: hypothetical protein HYY16_14230 [Planctomycetes bacterium]|nr:hypothetical protein [Planctomycetota bacterium]
MRLGDVTGNGVPEVIASSTVGMEGSSGSGGAIRVFLGDGSVAYAIPKAYTNEFGVISHAEPDGFSVVDLNGDQKGEILVNRSVLLGTLGTGSYQQALIAYDGTNPVLRLIASPVPDADSVLVFPAGCDGVGVVADDIDQDGQLDLIASYQSIRGTTDGFATHSIVYAWSVPNMYSAAAMEWPAFRGNRRQTGEYIPRSLRGGMPVDSTPPAAAQRVTRLPHSTGRMSAIPGELPSGRDRQRQLVSGGIRGGVEPSDVVPLDGTLMSDGHIE